MHTAFDITELNRRLANLIRPGKIVQADYPQARVKVQSGEMISGWLPWVTQRAGNDSSWWPPEVGEQVLILSPSGDPAQGIVLSGLYQNTHPAPITDHNKHHHRYSDGATIEYDRTAHHLKAILPAGGTVELVADGGITITGDITVNGDVIASGISLTQHLHTDVQSGPSNTGGPI